MKSSYLLFLLAFPAISFGQITGRVWQDVNANGQVDKLEIGAQAVAYNLIEAMAKTDDPRPLDGG